MAKSLKEYAEEVEQEYGVSGTADSIYSDVWMEAFDRWQKDQHTLDDLKALAAPNNAVIYNVCFRQAGCGILWHDLKLQGDSENWRDGLVVYAYYPSFQEAIDGEFKRLTKAAKETNE